MNNELYSALCKIETAQKTDEDEVGTPSFATIYKACDTIQLMCGCPADHPELLSLVAKTYSDFHVFQALFPDLDQNDIKDRRREARTFDISVPACGGPACVHCAFKGHDLLDIGRRSSVELDTLQSYAYRADKDRFAYMRDGFVEAGNLLTRQAMNVMLSRAGAYVAKEYPKDFRTPPNRLLDDPLLTVLAGSVFDLEKPAIFVRDGCTYANTFKMPRLIGEPGDHQWFVDFIKLLVPDGSEHVMRYIAALIQKPTKKITHAILIRSDPGTGKTLLTDFLASLLGPENVGHMGSDQLMKCFWAPFGSKLLGVCNEIFLPSEKMETYNRLKEVLADNCFSTEAKGVDSTFDFTPRGTFIFSNHATPFKIEPWDRRLFVTDSKKTAKHTDAYFGGLVERFNDPKSRAAVIHFLLNHPLGDFSRTAEPPMTPAKEELVWSSLRQIDHILAAAHSTQSGPFTYAVGTIEDVMHYVNAKLTGASQVNSATVSQAIKRLGCMKPKGAAQVRIGDTRPSMVILHDYALYQDMTAQQLKAVYERRTKPQTGFEFASDSEATPARSR